MDSARKEAGQLVGSSLCTEFLMRRPVDQTMI